jgi:molybdenum cofactor guanylyltransferase
MANMAQTTIDPADITGLVLCGGRGMRMGGVDKGLQNHRGMPLALHALMRLQAQVGAVLINANRNLAAYESMGVPVWPDALPAGVAEYPGPLAGWLAGLEHCDSAYLATVPCDSPQFPPDLVDRLATVLLAQRADIAMAATLEDGRVQRQPVFCLMKASLLESLVAYLQGGGRKIDTWADSHRCADVVFDDAQAFFNANTLQDLQRLA